VVAVVVAITLVVVVLPQVLLHQVVQVAEQTLTVTLEFLDKAAAAVKEILVQAIMVAQVALALFIFITKKD
jgi:hypothetical protein